VNVSRLSTVPVPGTLIDDIGRELGQWDGYVRKLVRHYLRRTSASLRVALLIEEEDLCQDAILRSMARLLTMALGGRELDYRRVMAQTVRWSVAAVLGERTMPEKRRRGVQARRWVDPAALQRLASVDDPSGLAASRDERESLRRWMIERRRPSWWGLVVDLTMAGFTQEEIAGIVGRDHQAVAYALRRIGERPGLTERLH